MKKFFLILFLILLSVNVFSLDIFGLWSAEFFVNQEKKTIEVEFLADTCIFYYENGKQNTFNYYIEEDERLMMFIAGSGYWIEEESDNFFKLVPAFESNVNMVYFKRG